MGGDGGARKIALVGLALRVPGAEDAGQLWRNLAAGVESVTRFGDAELAAAGVPAEVRRDPGYVPARGVLREVEGFDAPFFGFTPRQVRRTDPQHRILLECAWEALENAGHDARSYPGRIGVFTGVGAGTYLLDLVVRGNGTGELAGSEGFELFLGNDKDFAATRISYLLDLRGPSMTVGSACSSSLAAVHLACQSLLARECDMALAGGVSIRYPQEQGYLYQPDGIHAPDGHTRPFDADARGMVDGNGAAVVVLKRWADAVADGDFVWAVIRGSALSNDGAAKVGYTAPSVDGQAETIAEALAVAGVEPETVTYVEAHGTGTPLGDPIEIEALRQVFGDGRGRPPCALGSIKSNLGHLDTAAGVAGLIKAALALHHGEIPPTVNFRAPSPRLRLEESPFRVPAALEPWRSGALPRRAGVSSFGVGGTNVHVVLEEAPPRPPGGAARPWQLLALSARTPSALAAAAERLARHLEAHPADELAGDLADVAWTLQVGRRPFEHRRTLLARDAAEAVRRLRDGELREAEPAAGEGAGVAFLFPGQGAQALGLGRELYRAEPVFRAEVDHCADLLRPELGLDLRAVFAWEGAREGGGGALERASLGQPALFVAEYALARLWISWGVRPCALLGHSLGEYVAACLAGVFSLEDALGLVAERGRLVAAAPPGAMLAVERPAVDLARWLGDLDLAAVNGPDRSVLAGPPERIAAAERELRAAGIACRRLATAHAYHSRLLDPVLDRFAARVARVALAPGHIPCVSGLSGSWTAPGEHESPGYWARHLRETVRFGAALETLLAEPGLTLLEVGPGRTLGGLALRHPARTRSHAILASLPSVGGEGEQPHLLATLGRLWERGAAVDWAGFHAAAAAAAPPAPPGHRRRVPLPAYPFERQPHGPERREEARPADAAAHLPRRDSDPAGWFYAPSWTRRSLAPVPRVPAGQRVLILEDAAGLGAELGALLREAGYEVAALPAEDAAGAALERRLAAGWWPDLVLHLGNVLPGPEPEDPLAGLDRVQELGLHALLAVARLLGGRGGAARLVTVTDRLLEVHGERTSRPERGTLLGASRILAVEYPQLRSAVVDVDGDLRRAGDRSAAARQLAGLLGSGLLEREPGTPVCALRGGFCWVDGFAPVRLGDPGPPVRLRHEGVYLITGGFGGIGLHLAEYLAGAVERPRLVLLGRTARAPEGELGARLRALEAAGATVVAEVGDVADRGVMAELLARLRSRFGRLDGVIHCAGVADWAGVIHRRTRAATEEVLAPKMRGTLVLAGLLRDADLDFLVLCSSIGSVLVRQKYGQVGYAAANTFLEVFPASRPLRRGGAVICIGWDDWRQVGITVEAERRWGRERAEGFAFLTGETLLPEEGVEVFRRALGHALPRVIVSTRDLAGLVARDAAMAESYLDAAGRAPAAAPAPRADTEGQEPGAPLEQLLAAVWSDVLGVAAPGLHEDFAAAGGDSLAALSLARHLERRLGVSVGAADLFEAPTVAALAKRLAARFPHLAMPPADSPRPVPQAAADPAAVGDHPLSSTQRRLWFVEQLRTTGATYHMVVAVRLRGELEVAALERGLETLVRRQAVLRASFPAEKGSPVQRIAPPAPIFLPPETWAGPAPDADPDGFRRYLTAAASVPFDLRTGPVFRARLWRLAKAEHVLLLAVHHIVSDGVSMDLVASEVAGVYRACVEGAAPDLPPLPCQYTDVCAREQERIAAGALDELLERAAARLAGAPELELPARPHAVRRTSAGRASTFDLVAPGRRAAGSRERVTPSMLALTAFVASLWSFSGQTDLVLGTTLTTRDESTAGVVGLFVNQAVLRVDLEGALTLEDALVRVRTALLDAFALRDLPFDLLVQRLRLPRDAGRTPLVRANFVFQAGPGNELALPGLEVETLAVDPETAKYDLLLDVSRQGDRWRGFLEHSVELFEPRTVAALLERFRRALAALAAGETLALEELRVAAGPGRGRRRAVPLCSGPGAEAPFDAEG